MHGTIGTTGGQASTASKFIKAAQLDEILEAWRKRPLGECRYLYLDARYEKARVAAQMRDVAVLIAVNFLTIAPCPMVSHLLRWYRKCS